MIDQFNQYVQNALNEGRFKFTKRKALVKIDSDPLQVVDASYMDPVGVNMVEIT